MTRTYLPLVILITFVSVLVVTDCCTSSVGEGEPGGLSQAVGNVQEDMDGYEDEETIVIMDYEDEYPYKTPAWIINLCLIVAGLSAGVFFLFKTPALSTGPSIEPCKLNVPLKAAITTAIAIFSLGHFFAMLDVYLVTQVEFAGAEEFFGIMRLPHLVALSHSHLFGHSMVYIITAFIFVFTRLPEKLKTLIVFAALFGGVLDVASWWVIKYIGPYMEIQSMLGGMMMAGGFVFMAVVLIYEFWIRNPENPTDQSG